MTNGGGAAGSAFGISVPEGHVEVLEAAAENLEHVAHAADRASREMRRAAKVDGWEGSASAAFTHTIVQNAKPAEIAEEQLPRATKALMELADDLRHARRATKHAIKQARAAVERQRDAERDATAAQTRATNAHAEATALQGVIDGAAGRGDPAHDSREAQRDVRRAAAHAEDAVADARRRATKAEHDLEEAQRDGKVANERYDHACQRAAKVLRSVATAAPDAGKKDNDGLSWDDVYKFLLNRPGEKGLPAAALVLGLFKVMAAKRLYEAAGKASVWAKLNPAYAQKLLAEASPTLNRSPFLLKLAPRVARLPGMSRALGWLTSTARNPAFTKIGVAGGAIAVAGDLSNIASKINKGTWDDDPAAFASDIAKTGFDGAATWFLVSPTPLSAGAVAVTGAVWAATEVWDHWDGITDGLDKGYDAAKETVGKVADGAKDLAGDIGDGLSGAKDAALGWL